MSISLLTAAAGVVLALAGTIALVTRCVRMPRTDLIAWTCAMFGLAVALGAQADGFALGFGPVNFRVVQLGAQVVAPLALALGLAEVAARSLPMRFAIRLAVSALGIVSLVILATDPLGTAAFSKAFPTASVHYQPIPNSLLMYVLAPFTALVALIAICTTAARSRRDPAWRATLPAVAAAGVAALALAATGLAALASSKLHTRFSLAAAFPLLCVLAVVLTWLAVSQVRRIRLDVVHQSGAYDDDEGDTGSWRPRRSWSSGDETGDYDPLTDADGRGRYAAVGDHRQYPEEQGFGSYIDEAGYQQSGRRERAADADYEQPDYRQAGGEGSYGDDGDYGPDVGHAAAGGLAARPAGGRYDDAALAGGAAARDLPGGELPGDPVPGSALPEGARPEGALPGGAPAGPAAGLVPGAAAAADPLADGLHAGTAPAGTAPAGGGYDGAAQRGQPGMLSGPSEVLPPQPGWPGQAGMPAADDHEAWSRLFGQIAIYTLLEDRVDAFDGLTEEVVELVRTREPDTLVYIVHAVPSAPMQRILYEVYRDREAYEQHRRQPYIAKFEADRRPYVLATNVIELGLQHAKVMPIPAIPDLLSRGHGGGPPAGPGPAVPGGPVSAGVLGAGALDARVLGAEAPGSSAGPDQRPGGHGGGSAGLGQGPRRVP
jgi:quinol monooxygenase YgiN